MKDKRHSTEVKADQSYVDAVKFYGNGDILIRFGIHDDKKPEYKKYTGYVEPTCGEIRITKRCFEDSGRRKQSRKYSTLGGWKLCLVI